MELSLSPIEIRLLACLVEKSLSAPEYYPLTLNALVAACNQKSNRDPVLQASDQDVVRTLDALRDRGLASSVTLAGSRVPKYRHRMTEVYPLVPAQLAVLCELMLRGPQTAGELRTHASRLCSVVDTAEVLAILQQLADWPGTPLVSLAARRSGQREDRYAHLLGGPLPAELESSVPSTEPARLCLMAETERMAVLETKVKSMEDELASLKAQFTDLVRQLQ